MTARTKLLGEAREWLRSVEAERPGLRNFVNILLDCTAPRLAAQAGAPRVVRCCHCGADRLLFEPEATRVEGQADDATQAARMRGLRNLAGYVEDGSSEAVTFYQDDATRCWTVKVGKREYYGDYRSLGEAIDNALKHQEPTT